MSGVLVQRVFERLDRPQKPQTFGLGNIPYADNYPRGAFVLSADGTDRSKLRWSVFWLSILVFSLGLGVGWYTWGRKR